MTDDGKVSVGTIALPLILLIAVAGLVLVANPGQWLERSDAPPSEALNFGRMILEPGVIEFKVTNEGPDPVRISQVLVDEAYWQHTIEPDATLDPMDTATITLQYPWVEGEAHEIVVLTETGASFSHEIEVALETPGVSAQTLGVYALIGLLVGVVPIFAGLLWYPAIRKAGTPVEMGILAFTIGLLAFLVVDSLEEGLELAELAPAPIGGPGLVLLAVAAAMAILLWTSQKLSGQAGHGTSRSRLVAAYMIAVGIGLHNLGEGLAIGAAYAVGEVALGSFLILGFTLHNVTEGPAIVAPLARRSTAIKHLAFMGLIAGAPTIAGAWIGGLAFSPFLGAIFFGLGAGAMLQVILDVAAEMRGEPMLDQLKGTIALGFLAGIAVMWGTGVLTA